MNREKALLLVEKYNNGSASKEEKILLENWYAGQSAKMKISDGEIDFELLEKPLYYKTIARAGLNKKTVIRRPYYTWSRIAAAASVLLVISIGIYFLMRSKPDRVEIAKGQDIAPGGNRAVLTLANGQQILLTGAHNGQLATQNHALINKTADGMIAYQTSGRIASGTVTYNTLETPHGGQYCLTLSDGTRVILDAASSITYPVNFTGKERRVKLSGEAYFEVAHNAAMPFHVDTKTQDVEDLGTHFNINSYGDEQGVKTTLLQGSVKITDPANSMIQTILVPGQQATISNDQIVIRAVDAEDEAAWKDGIFIFENETLEHAMLKISRWYDLKVVYKDEAIKMLNVGGSISRFGYVSDILRLFAKSGKVHFTVTNKTLFISKE